MFTMQMVFTALTNVIRVIQLGIMRSARHAICTKDEKCVQKFGHRTWTEKTTRKP